MRCINCGIATQRLRRHFTASLPDVLLMNLARWLTIEVPRDANICHPCYKGLNSEAANDGRLLGHTMLCITCGHSVRSIQRHAVERNDVMLLDLPKSHPAFHQTVNYMCHPCWMRHQRQTNHHQNRSTLRKRKPLPQAGPEPERAEPYKEKVGAVCKMLTPTMVTELQHFMGMENSSFKSKNDGSSIKSYNTRSTVLPIIVKVFIFLEREYEYMKTLNGDNCDLSPLADILKRTAEATGFDEDDVIMVMEREGLADHLPDRARRKRKKSCVSQHDEVLERDNLDVTVKKETTSHTAITPGSTYVFLTSETEQTQVKVEPEDNEDVTSHNVLHHIPPLGSNSSPTYVSLTSDTEQTQVKVEPEDNGDVTSHNVLHNIPPLGSNVEYFNQDEDDKMDIEQYTFTGTRPNAPPNPTASVSEHADIKIEPADYH